MSWFSKEQLQSTVAGLSGASKVFISAVASLPGATNLQQAIEQLAARSGGPATTAALGSLKASRTPSDPNAPVALVLEERGAASGVASLGADGKVPDTQSQVPSAHVGSRDGHPAATNADDGFITGAQNARIHDRLHGLGSQDHSDVLNSPQDGQVQVFRSAGAQGIGYYHESPGAASVPNATETEAGKVEKGTAAEAQSATDSGTSGPLYIAPSVLAAEITRRLTPEAWHTVGAAGEPAFQNGWINSGGAHQVVQFRKEPGGLVRVRGAVKSGGTGPIFTLPSGLRPSATETFPTSTDNSSNMVLGRVTVTTDGGVNYAGGGGVFHSLAGVVFVAA